jgi:hypothetical protein
VTTDELAGLRAEIESHFRSIHAFCRQRPTLNKATVYMVLAGTYPGNTPRQAERIRRALSGRDAETRIFEAIKRVACARCTVSGKCNRCDALFRAQAKAVLDVAQ